MKTFDDIQAKFKAFLKRLPERRLMMLLSIVVGAACGFAAVILKSLVGLIHSGVSSLGNSWIYFVCPGIGMLISLLFVRFVIKDDIGHGVTKVLQAVSKNESRIKPHNMWSSIVASSFTIGFGGSVGAEAPIVYTGAAIGSNVGRFMELSYKNITLLLGCGAAGAVAGIFNAPLAGILFTLEILLFNISMSSIIPLLFSSVSATVISCLFLGNDLTFACNIEPFAMRNIGFYILLGLFCAVCSLYFTRMTLWLEDKIKAIDKVWVRWLIASLILGLLIFLFPPLWGEGYDSLAPLLGGTQITAQGNSFLSFFLESKWGILVLFALVIILKVFSMSLTNAGGGVGGTFGPTLFVGAIAGFVLARFLNLIFAKSAITIPEQNFVMVGMAGLMAGVMQAPMTAIFLIAEITGGYDLLIPLILTATVSYGATRAVEPYSIYTKRIAKAGELLTHDNDKTILTLLKVDNILRDKYPRISVDATLGELVDIISESQAQVFPVVDSDDKFMGLIEMDKIRKLMFQTDKYDSVRVFNIMEAPAAYLYQNESMASVMDKFDKTGAWRLPVVTGENHYYLGFVSKSRIFSAYREELKEISQD